MKHNGLRLKKCINSTAKHNWITKLVQNYVSGVKYNYFHGICTQHFIICVRSDIVDDSSWHFVTGSCGSCKLNIHFDVRSCRSWIFKVCSVKKSWGSWILRILDTKFMFHRGDCNSESWLRGIHNGKGYCINSARYPIPNQRLEPLMSKFHEWFELKHADPGS